jgi:hypothetical protein
MGFDRKEWAESSMAADNVNASSQQGPGGFVGSLLLRGDGHQFLFSSDQSRDHYHRNAV